MDEHVYYNLFIIFLTLALATSFLLCYFEHKLVVLACFFLTFVPACSIWSAFFYYSALDATFNDYQLNNCTITNHTSMPNQNGYCRKDVVATWDTCASGEKVISKEFIGTSSEESMTCPGDFVGRGSHIKCLTPSKGCAKAVYVDVGVKRDNRELTPTWVLTCESESADGTSRSCSSLKKWGFGLSLCAILSTLMAVRFICGCASSSEVEVITEILQIFYGATILVPIVWYHVHLFGVVSKVSNDCIELEAWLDCRFLAQCIFLLCIYNYMTSKKSDKIHACLILLSIPLVILMAVSFEQVWWNTECLSVYFRGFTKTIWSIDLLIFVPYAILVLFACCFWVKECVVWPYRSYVERKQTLANLKETNDFCSEVVQHVAGQRAALSEIFVNCDEYVLDEILRYSYEIELLSIPSHSDILYIMRIRERENMRMCDHTDRTTLHLAWLRQSATLRRMFWFVDNDASQLGDDKAIENFEEQLPKFFPFCMSPSVNQNIPKLLFFYNKDVSIVEIGDEDQTRL